MQKRLQLNICPSGLVRDGMTIITDEQVAYINEGGVIAYPTSTLLGLGCLPTKEGLHTVRTQISVVRQTSVNRCCFT